ncbi:2-C-methyl-D-erythritol 2,4-cyclodiphosphate synthase [Buchnera aphidicola str. Ak (Acyrthosiphon kondoi)]|uniref:2-C-methyl-D-erythritol 2,4-cyclodiphosphate synthase n=1 Tax=Buchnera aphidicola str. Ak (Acyrthosiphon kondoi) TaxID=1005090 RepID=G2LNB9_9GAMM|nr:2-C-methyl-D-erythritol 2,4-cyclodiphosphate synthase [Buchnera aphidicola]AEO08757.1 2-C-methyl-D-erythritol 2,4-cyclodiphosphate synthase [Buchnera aphidicola str. Ak (Acyrthosiphon kondoi)]WAI18439.1 MAG: 2-C-methyl-D-erythritol 2,4-cyclodiphosphate synthase [Buchnera aphidicola (Acyrthosiphon caraganae)]
MRIGYGFDLHSFGSTKPLIIGGVLIPYDQGLVAHSNGDLLIHSVIDALLGATAMGDIGTFFPSDNKIYKNIDSRILLKKIWKKIKLMNYDISNIDITIIAEYPQISPYVFFMRSNLSLDLDTQINNISIKSTSSKKIGCIGRREGIACHAIVMLIKNKKYI